MVFSESVSHFYSRLLRPELMRRVAALELGLVVWVGKIPSRKIREQLVALNAQKQDGFSNLQGSEMMIYRTTAFLGHSNWQPLAILLIYKTKTSKSQWAKYWCQILEWKHRRFQIDSTSNWFSDLELTDRKGGRTLEEEPFNVITSV